VRFSGPGAATVDLSQTAEQNTGHGRDTVREFEKAYGSAGADHLIGTAGANELDGAGGDDILDGRGGADELRGGSGADTVSYADAPTGVTIDLTNADQATDGDRIYLAESVIGSRFGDRLTGGEAPQGRVVGAAGTDVITGGALIEVRDGEPDQVTCGPFTNKVISDQRSLDALGSLCLNVDALPEPQQPGDPGTGTPGTGTPDTTLEFTLGGARKQRLLRQKAVYLKVACPSEPCTTVATSTGKLRLRPLEAGVAAGTARTLKLRLTRKQLTTVRKALTTERRPSLTVRVVARDSAGNTVQRERRITAIP
jgi:RTX calcium-binding nonapeptide repeat (4 copies)